MLNLMRRAGAFALFRRANRDKALILTYHRFTHEGSGEAVFARAFAEHVSYLAKHYSLMTLSALARHLKDGDGLPPGIAVITIDDGYRDAYEIAFPILHQYNAPATLFAVTDFVDRKGWLWTDKLRFLTARTGRARIETEINNQTLSFTLNGHISRAEAAARINSALKALPDDSKEEAINALASSLGVRLPGLPPDEYGPITWEQAREMQRCGIEVGSHTKTHPMLTQVDDARLLGELLQSRARLEAVLNRSVDLFCYPNGGQDERIRRAAQMSGYNCAVTTELGFNDQGADLMQLRRMDTEASFMRFVQITSGFDQLTNELRRARAGRAGSLARQ
jgi:peptidoglycan/xylan/chitin deacetylase (PgdA/CDA1 family)